MLTITSVITDDGDSALELLSTIKFAAYFAELNEFEIVGLSNVSEAIYLARPDCDQRLRIAAHGGRRDNVIAGVVFPKERCRSDGEACWVVPLQPYEVVDAIRTAMASYDAQVSL